MIDILKNGFQDFARYVDTLPDIATRAASMSLNQIMKGPALTLARDTIYEEVAYPKGYLEAGRLAPGKTASPSSLSASIVGRERPTSLARFSSGTIRFGRVRRGATLTVTVKPGAERTLKAFFIPLRVGAARTETVFNLGLAVRLAPGQTPDRSMAAIEIFPNVWLLYGPSVAQVFETVKDEIAPAVVDMASQEFLRQWVRLGGL